MAAAAVSATTIVPDLLDRKNYENWSVYMKNYLMAQHLWSIVEHGIPSSTTTTGRSLGKSKAKNAAALHAIHITCSPPIFAQIRGIGSAKDAWDELARMMMHQEESSSSSSSEGEEEEEEEESTITVSSVDYAELRRGMWKGERDAVYQFLEKYPINTVVGDDGGTILHLAIRARQDEIAEKLVEMMSITDLQIKNFDGNTALSIAACRNRINVAKCLVQKHPQLLSISGFNEEIPTTVASLAGNGEMARYLYSVTPPQVFGRKNDGSIDQGSLLLCTSISSKMFDISLNLLEQNLHLAVCTEVQDQSPILVLSTQSDVFYSGRKLFFWQQWIYNLIKIKELNTPIGEVIGVNNTTFQIHDRQKTGIQVIDRLLGATSFIPRFLGIKEIYDLKLSHLYALQVLRCMCNHVFTLNLEQHNKYKFFMAALEATKRGTYEFVSELLKVDPTSLRLIDADDRSFFMIAIQYRQEKVFNLFYDNFETWKVDCVIFTDNKKNNILHVAGELAPAFQLSRISGEALQMQRELQWFKEVEKFTPIHMKEAKNCAGLSPREVFTKSHSELLKEGGKWMKGTSKSFIIVGTLIVTIMFAVAFTVPGGNDQITGFPIFLGEKAFKIFLILDAISFFAASTSILMFLGILTSRYAEDDFLVSLPTKLIIGLSTLFISTAAMMVSFSATLVIMLRGQWLTIIPILVMAGIPVTLFVWLQFPLLVRIFVSTYGSGIFGKKVKVQPQFQ